MNKIEMKVIYLFDVNLITFKYFTNLVNLKVISFILIFYHNYL
jgi:hypothetical protein